MEWDAHKYYTQYQERFRVPQLSIAWNKSSFPSHSTNHFQRRRLVHILRISYFPQTNTIFAQLSLRYSRIYLQMRALFISRSSNLLILQKFYRKGARWSERLIRCWWATERNVVVGVLWNTTLCDCCVLCFDSQWTSIGQAGTPKCRDTLNVSIAVLMNDA